MTKQEFEIEVQKLSNKDDFRLNKDILISIPESRYNSFLKLLMIGCNLHSANMSLATVKSISIDTKYTEEEIIDLIPRFIPLVNSFSCGCEFYEGNVRFKTKICEFHQKLEGKNKIPLFETVEIDIDDLEEINFKKIES